MQDGGVLVSYAHAVGTGAVGSPKGVEQARLAQGGQARLVVQVEGAALHPLVAVGVALVHVDRGTVQLKQAG